MADENTQVAPHAAPEPEYSQSFADAYADLIGDLSHVPDDAPEPSPAPVAVVAPVGSEDVKAAEPTGAPPAEAAPIASDEAVKDPEPTNATYRVNGEDRTFDGIKVYPDKSGLIPPEQMDAVLQRLGERDNLFERSQEQHTRFEALQAEHANATRWKLDDGREVSGREGAQARDMAYALTRAERDAFNTLLSDPNTVFNLLAQDAQGNVIWNKTAVDIFQAKLENVKLQLSHAVQQRHAQPAPAAAPAYVAPDPNTVADTLISHTGVKGFGAEDKAYVAELAKAYVRPATKEDVANDPANARLGQPYAPPALIGLIRDRSALLARSAKTVETATAAERENQAKLAQARIGKPATARPATPIAPVPSTAKTREELQDERFERESGAAAQVLRQSVMQPA